MRLSAILRVKDKYFIGPIVKFRGSALKGSHRFVPPATKGTRYMLWQQWRNEEEVLKYISKPYITEEEERSIGGIEPELDALARCKIVEPMRQRYTTEILDIFERSRQFEILD